MRIKVGGQIVDTDRIWDVRHKHKSLLVEISISGGKELEFQFSNSEDADFVAYVLGAYEDYTNAVVPARKNKRMTEINLKGKIVDVKSIAAARIDGRCIIITMDVNAKVQSNTTISCKSTREAKELFEYLTDKINESNGCTIEPDPLHNNKFRNLVAEIRRLSSHLYYSRNVPTNAWVYEVSNYGKRVKNEFEFNRKLKLLEWEFVTVTGYWYSPWLVDAVEKLEVSYKRKIELEDEREITMYEYEDRTGRPITEGSPEDSHIRSLDIELGCLDMVIKRQEKVVEDYKKGLKATPDELRIAYPNHHINEDGSLMDCPPPSTEDSGEFTFVIQKHGYYSMY